MLTRNSALLKSANNHTNTNFIDDSLCTGTKEYTVLKSKIDKVDCNTRNKESALNNIDTNSVLNTKLNLIDSDEGSIVINNINKNRKIINSKKQKSKKKLRCVLSDSDESQSSFANHSNTEQRPLRDPYKLRKRPYENKLQNIPPKMKFKFSSDEMLETLGYIHIKFAEIDHNFKGARMDAKKFDLSAALEDKDNKLNSSSKIDYTSYKYQPFVKLERLQNISNSPIRSALLVNSVSNNVNSFQSDSTASNSDGEGTHTNSNNFQLVGPPDNTSFQLVGPPDNTSFHDINSEDDKSSLCYEEYVNWIKSLYENAVQNPTSNLQFLNQKEQNNEVYSTQHKKANKPQNNKRNKQQIGKPDLLLINTFSLNADYLPDNTLDKRSAYTDTEKVTKKPSDSSKDGISSPKNISCLPGSDSMFTLLNNIFLVCFEDEKILDELSVNISSFKHDNLQNAFESQSLNRFDVMHMCNDLINGYSKDINSNDIESKRLNSNSRNSHSKDSEIKDGSKTTQVANLSPTLLENQEPSRELFKSSIYTPNQLTQKNSTLLPNTGKVTNKNVASNERGLKNNHIATSVNKVQNLDSNDFIVEDSDSSSVEETQQLLEAPSLRHLNTLLLNAPTKTSKKIFRYTCSKKARKVDSGFSINSQTFENIFPKKGEDMTDLMQEANKICLLQFSSKEFEMLNSDSSNQNSKCLNPIGSKELILYKILKTDWFSEKESSNIRLTVSEINNHLSFIKKHNSSTPDIDKPIDKLFNNNLCFKNKLMSSRLLGPTKMIINGKNCEKPNMNHFYPNLKNDESASFCSGSMNPLKMFKGRFPNTKAKKPVAVPYFFEKLISENVAAFHSNLPPKLS